MRKLLICGWTFFPQKSAVQINLQNLKDLCLHGTVASDLRNLVHIKSIILRNNSFTGTIPEGIGKLKELEVLDFGYNDFRGPLPSDLGNNLSLTILLLDNNRLLGNLAPEIHQLKMFFEFQVDENQLSGGAKVSCCDIRSITRYWTHIVMAYAFTFWTCFVLMKEYEKVTNMRLDFLSSEKRRPDQ